MRHACGPINHGSVIRLTDERWLHITEEQAAVVEGAMGELLAYREMEAGKIFGGGL
jgi:hypothetical protein